MEDNKKNKTATNLKNVFNVNKDDIVKKIIELYEFQENIKINYKRRTIQ